MCIAGNPLLSAPAGTRLGRGAALARAAASRSISIATRPARWRTGPCRRPIGSSARISRWCSRACSPSRTRSCRRRSCRRAHERQQRSRHARRPRARRGVAHVRHARPDERVRARAAEARLSVGLAPRRPAAVAHADPGAARRAGRVLEVGADEGRAHRRRAGRRCSPTCRARSSVAVARRRRRRRCGSSAAARSARTTRG